MSAPASSRKLTERVNVCPGQQLVEDVEVSLLSREGRHPSLNITGSMSPLSFFSLAFSIYLNLSPSLFFLPCLIYEYITRVYSFFINLFSTFSYRRQSIQKVFQPCSLEVSTVFSIPLFFFHWFISLSAFLSFFSSFLFTFFLSLSYISKLFSSYPSFSFSFLQSFVFSFFSNSLFSVFLLFLQNILTLINFFTYFIHFFNFFTNFVYSFFRYFLFYFNIFSTLLVFFLLSIFCSTYFFLPNFFLFFLSSVLGLLFPFIQVCSYMHFNIFWSACTNMIRTPFYLSKSLNFSLSFKANIKVQEIKLEWQRNPWVYRTSYSIVSLQCEYSSCDSNLWMDIFEQHKSYELKQLKYQTATTTCCPELYDYTVIFTLQINLIKGIPIVG